MARAPWRLVVLAAVVVATLAFACVAAADKTYTDPTGDPVDSAGIHHAGSSDLTELTISHSPTEVSFQVRTTQPLNPTHAHGIWIYLDTDRNPATGGWSGTLKEGFELSLHAGAGATAAYVRRWDGAKWASTSLPLSARAVTSTVIAITMKRASAWPETTPRPTGFEVVVAIISPYSWEQGDGDYYPDSGALSYELTDPPIILAKARVVPAKPKAGAVATVSSAISGLGGDLPVKVSCSARLAGGAALKTTGSFASGRAMCKVKVPSTAKAKQVKGQLTATAGTSSAKTGFTFRTAG